MGVYRSDPGEWFRKVRGALYPRGILRLRGRGGRSAQDDKRIEVALLRMTRTPLPT